jgi:hypothetical protein
MNVMTLRGLFIAAALLCFSSLAFAASGTPEEQAACTPDVRKFCHAVKEADGDEAFLKCLELHRDDLSESCRGVLKNHGM